MVKHGTFDLTFYLTGKVSGRSSVWGSGRLRESEIGRYFTAYAMFVKFRDTALPCPYREYRDRQVYLINVESAVFGPSNSPAAFDYQEIGFKTPSLRLRERASPLLDGFIFTGDTLATKYARVVEC